ncbi:histone-lysine N-methyltransferase, H3 lysine-36 specific-like [Crotalus tigris]|uniref:histone-lysine N-methyltransferase, H3 lysine-36 specific-like n=1 Tax=Crotalus tigris TaxID=88082 RepID=UPI00192F4847|nr:histone-lysine N-methyltransferase, H3 lysine-36 specific-like [Crotalus tigris]
MEKSEASHLVDTQEALKKEIWDLREKAVNLDLENQEIVKEIKHMNEENKSLEEKVSCFKTIVEDLEKEEEELQEMLQEREDTRASLEAQNQTLAETNKVLCSRIEAVSNQLFRFQESKDSRDQGILRIKQVMEHIVGYFKQLEAKIEMAKHQYEDEKKQSAELARTVVELEEICKALENQVLSLEEQLELSSFSRLKMDAGLEGPSLLQEMVQAKLKQDSRGLQKSFFLLLSRGTWVLVAMTLGLGFSHLLLFLFGQDLAGGNYLLTLTDGLKWVSKTLSPYPVRRQSGLRPF